MSEETSFSGTERLIKIWHSPVRRRIMQLKWWVNGLLLPFRIKTVQVGKEIRVLGDDEFVVLTTFRNGALYLHSFLEHYRRLGAGLIVLLDNGSSDESYEIIKQCPEVCLLSTSAPYAKSNVPFRHYLQKRFAGRGWAVLVDIDELLDYPQSSKVSVRQFLGYLNDRGYSAVQGYMLDRFAKTPVGEAGSQPGDNLEEKYPYYDLNDIIRRSYSAEDLGPKGSLGAEEVRDYSGGVRVRTLKANPFLSKFPLVRYRKYQVLGVHKVYNAAIADVSVVLNHFKFLDNLEAVARHYKEEKDPRYNYVLSQSECGKPLCPYSEDAEVWGGVDKLIEQEFLHASETYLRIVKGLDEHAN